MLKPELAELQKAVVPVATEYANLDDEANALLGRYNDYVSPPHSRPILFDTTTKMLTWVWLGLADFHAVRDFHLVARDCCRC